MNQARCQKEPKLQNKHHMGKTGNLWTLAHAEGLSHAKVDEIREDSTWEFVLFIVSGNLL